MPDEVARRVSAIARRVLLHDLLALPLLLESREEVQVYAITGNTGGFPAKVPFDEQHRWMITTAWEYQLFDDMQNDPTQRDGPPGRAGYHS